MKIIGFEHWTEPLALKRPYRIAGRTIADVENHFVRLEAANGTCGYGAASPAEEVTGESMSDCAAAARQYLEACVAGRDLRCLPAVTGGLRQQPAGCPAARAAVDMALYDLAGKLLDLPLSRILGCRQNRLPTSITIGIQAAAEALAEAGEYVGRGFRILKVKIGDSLEADLDLLRQLRDKVGDRIHIRVDANQGYTGDQLRDFHRRTQELALELIEQPLPVAGDDEMRDLPAELRARCAADESLCSDADAMRLACTPRPFGIYNIKLMKCGGVTPALDMIRMAEAAGIDLMWGCNDESCVSIAAALHTALSSAATRYLDLDGSFDLGRDIFAGGFVLENGALRPNGEPGLGVRPV